MNETTYIITSKDVTVEYQCNINTFRVLRHFLVPTSQILIVLSSEAVQIKVESVDHETSDIPNLCPAMTASI